MKKLILVLSIGLLSSCTKEVQPMTREQMKAKIDSIISAGRQQSDEQARIDLDRRMKIEVKVKVDSILNARVVKAAHDTTAKKIPGHPKI
jgi:predicted lipoprotein